MSELVLVNENQHLFNRLIEELKYALSGFTSKEIREIFFESAKFAGIVTYETKKNSLKNTGKFIKKTYQRYRDEGVSHSAKNDTKRAGDFIAGLPQRSKELYNDFIKLPRDQKIEVTAVTILTLSIFFATAGGFDLEGGLPDSDITISGIDAHRSVFTHSIIIGLGVEFAARFGILVMEKMHGRLPDNHHEVWDRVYGFIDKNKNLALGAMWAGIAAHLLLDSGIIGGDVKPYQQLPNGLPMETHQGLFTANSLASGIFSKS